MSLTTCMRKAGDALRAEDKAAILAAAAKYRKAGMGADEAGRKAVDEQIAAVQALLDVPADAAATSGKTYPLASAGSRYEETDKPITMMTPDAYLAAVRPLEIDEASRDNIDDLKRHILSGKKLDPLHIRANGKEDGRHRAVAAKELGIKLVPVVDERAAQPAVVEDFGEKLPPARRAMAAKLDEDLSDEDIAKRPLSEIWPLAENEAIEDTFAAAVAHAARAEVPAKPRQPYKLRQWVAKVKTVRELAGKIVSGRVTRERMIELVNTEQRRLKDWMAKVLLLEQVPRDQWKRIGAVEERPEAFTYEDGKQVPTPMLRLEIDGKGQWLRGDTGIQGEERGTVAGNKAAIMALLAAAEPDKRMEFEIRGPSGGPYKINKKGDPEYRPLMKFATPEEARRAINVDYDSLVAAWEGVKARDNITERDLRSAENRPRAGKDHRGGKDIDAQQFQDTFGFRGGEFGKWVQQGKGDKERQALLNSAYDALMDLSDIVGVPPKAISLNGTLGIAFGSRGSGWASAHFEPSNLVINLTKTRGAGSLAHEWLHALDNYFGRMRRGGEEAKFTGDKKQYDAENFITHKPEPLMVKKDGRWPPMTKTRLEQLHKTHPTAAVYDPANWMVDPKHPDGVRPEVEKRFADLVDELNASPMAKRAQTLDKGRDGYWSSTLEMAARAFESFVMARMHESGYHNDFLVNVRKAEEVAKDPARYPYLMAGEIKPIADAFAALFDTIQTRTDDDGNVAMFSRANIGRRDFLLGMAASAAPVAGSAAVTVGRAKPVSETVFAQQMPADIAKALRGNGSRTTNLEGAKVVREALDKIAKTGPQELRVLAAQVRDVAPAKSLLLTVDDTGLWNAHGAVTWGIEGPHLKLFTAEGRTGLTYGTFLHEVMHAAVLARYQTLSTGVMRQNDHVLNLPAPKAAKELEQFRQLYEEFRSEGWKKKAPDDATGLSVREAMSSPDEFFVRALTDGRFQAFLADIEYRGKSMLERFKDWVKSTLFGLSRDGTAPSWLDAALLASSEVLTGMGKDAADFQRMRAIQQVSSQRSAMFSRASTGRGITMTDARAVAGNIRAALPKAPPIILHESVDKAPRKLRDAIAAEGAERDVEAAYHEGEIHVFPSHIESIERMEFVVGRHELRHYGIRAMLGPRYGQTLLAMVQKNPTLREAARKKIDDGLARSMVEAADEALADMSVEDIAALNGFDRFVSAIRQWLRDMAASLRKAGMPRLADAIDPKEWTDRDVAAFVLKAEDMSRKGSPESMSTGGTMFSNPAQTETEAFRRWFGDSKVVDENGEPLVVYHGTADDIAEFKPGPAHKAGHGKQMRAIYFSPLPATAAAYARTAANAKDASTDLNGANVVPAYVSISNPAEFTDVESFASANRAELEAAGHDGALRRNQAGEVVEIAAFRPEQIKSATGNRGTFDPASPDIRFSRAPGLNMTRASQDLVNARGGVFDFNRIGETKQDRIRTVIDGARPFWLGALTRDQIADVFGDEIAPVRDYDQLTRSMENERQKMAQDADKLYNEWTKLPEAANDRLARIMLDATVNSVHPDKDAGLPKKATPEQRAVHARIRAEFKALPPEAQAMYGKVKAFHENTLAQLRQAIEARIDRQVENGAAKQATLTNIRKMFDKYMGNGPYFPLSRFGDFLVIGTRGDGERVVAAYENAGEQQAAARALQADGFTVKMKTSKTYSRETDGSAGQFIGDVMMTLEKVDMVEATINGSRTDLKNQLLDDINQLFIKSLPDLSYRKHFTHRKNTPGFSADVMRGFAAAAFHSASHIARVNHGDQMTFALRDAYSAIENAPEGDFNKHTQVLNELTKRHEAALNPNTHPIASMLNQVGFVMYLGLSPAAGLVNLLQTPMVTLPHLGARYGFGKATASMAKATSDIVAAPMNKQSGWDATASDKLTAAEKAAMKEMQDEGIIDLTQAHDLASASGLDTGNVARSKAAFAMSRAMKIVGWTFHVPEVMNRQVTALSAYRLEMEKSGDAAKAKDAAREAIRRTHFDYSSSNRARYMQGNIARVAMQFKQYAQNMTYLLGRAAQQALSGETPEVRRIARRQLVATLGATFGMAGALGLPGLGAAMGLIGMMVEALDDDDEPWDWKVEFRNLMADTFGQEAGEVISHGLPRALMPWDIAGRVGMGELWWRSSDREGQNPREAFATDIGNILGPTAGTMLGWYTASDHMARGDYSKAAEAVVPKFIRDPLKALRESQEGVTSYNGEPLKDTTVAEELGRLLGFAPASVSEMYEGRGAVMNAKTSLDEKRQRLLSQVAKARMDRDAERERELREKIAEFNRRNPEYKITGSSIVKSVMARRRNRANTEAGIMLPDTKDFLRERARFAVTQ